jgi:hypothetical protein
MTATGSTYPAVYQATYSTDLAVATAVLPDGEVGVPYSCQLQRSGGILPVAWAATGLPAGLACSPAGLIAGTPAFPGPSTAAVAVIDSAVPSPVTATASLPLTIAPARPPAVFVPGPVLLPVTWDGLSLNDGDRGDGLTTVVTSVDGWYGSPPLAGNDLARQLTDGSIFGFKTVGARVITIQGAAVADDASARAALNTFARDLAARAANPEPADLAIGEDTGAGDGSVTLLSASVRADSDLLAVTWTGRLYLAWQVVLTAADPRLYEATWQSQTLIPAASGAATGRAYPWQPQRSYASADVPNAARMANDGSVAAPVWVTYYGDLSESRLTDGLGTIHLAPLAAGQEIVVNSETLAAAAPGGASRASYLMAGTAPLLIPAESDVQWSLYGTGGGHVTLTWRGVYA